jgi:hypothetical protein
MGLFLALLLAGNGYALSEEFFIKKTPDQTVLISGDRSLVQQSADVFIIMSQATFEAPAILELEVELPWHTKVWQWIKSLFGMQSALGTDVVLSLGESPARLDANNPSIPLHKAIYTEATFKEKDGTTRIENIMFGAQFDFTPGNKGASVLVSKGNARINSDPSGYVIIDSKTQTANWYAGSSREKLPEEKYKTIWEFNIDRDAYGATFVDERLWIVKGSSYTAKVAIDNLIANNIDCALEVSVGTGGLYVGERSFVTERQKCNIGKTYFTIPVDTSKFGEVTVKANAILYFPSSTTAKITKSREDRCNVYIMGEGVVVDLVSAEKTYRIVDASIYESQSATEEKYQTFG